MNSPDFSKGMFGPGSPEEIQQRINEGIMANNLYMMRPVENLRVTPLLEMEDREKLPIFEAFRSMTTDAHLTLFRRLEHGMLTFRYKTEFYTTQNEREGITRQTGMLENMILGMPESRFEINEQLLIAQTSELKRAESALNIWEWALPYKATYYGGLDSMGLLPQRGGQLYLGDMEIMIKGVTSGMLDEATPPAALSPTEFPESQVEKRQKEIKLWHRARELLPKTENEETIADRYGKYVADADFIFRAVGEMNTYDSTTKGEKLELTKTMQQFLGDIFQRRTRVLETGTPENIGSPTQKIKVYLDEKGNQILQDENGNPLQTPKETHEQFIDVLDYYNKARSDEESEYFVCAAAAMAIHKAKDILDSLPHDPELLRGENNPDGSKYNQLFKAVHDTAMKMMSRKGLVRKEDLNFVLAKSAVLMADAIAFGSMDVGERGGSYSWEFKPVYDPKDINLPENQRKILGYIWVTEPGQGDPTAAGDAFTAAKPLLHETIYQAIKSRLSAFGQGLNIPIDGSEENKLLMAKVFMSEAARLNEKNRVVELVKSGKHQYLATYFGMLGAFKEELGQLDAWKAGETRRKNLGKVVNENFSRAVEDYVVFIPTPFNFKNVDKTGIKQGGPIKNAIDSFAVGDENIIYPMLVTIQSGVSLFDMLSVSNSAKDKNPYSAGDMLRKSWKKIGDVWVETPPEQGGKRLTYRDINWGQYPRYAEDGSAVNRKFMLDIIAPLYGATNPKEVELAEKDPMTYVTGKIKASDIGYRWIFKKLSRTGEKVKRPTLEIMSVSTDVFNGLTVGAYGLIGRGAISRYFNFVEEKLPAEIAAGQKQNLYTTLRNLEDLLQTKQNYDHYSDTFFVANIAQSIALEPVAIASDLMAVNTTNRFEKMDSTGVKKWKELRENHP